MYDSVGQEEFKQRSEGTACFWALIFGVSAGAAQTAAGGMGHRSGVLVVCVVFTGAVMPGLGWMKWLGASQHHFLSLHTAPLGFLTAQQPGNHRTAYRTALPRKRNSRSSRSCKEYSDRGSEILECHFCSILSIKASTSQPH